MASRSSSSRTSRTGPSHEREATNEGALQEQCELVRELLSKADVDEIRTRYRIGQVIASLRERPNLYGMRAVGTLADAVGRDEATLYRYAQVVDCWDADALEALLKRTGAPSLSWSHLLVLAGVSDEERRKELLEEVLAQGVSVRKLGRLVRDEDAIVGQIPGPRTVVAELQHLISTSHTLLLRAPWEGDEGLPADPALLPLLEQAMARQAELQEVFTRNLDRLRALRTRIHTERLSRPRIAPARARPTGGARLLAGYA